MGDTPPRNHLFINDGRDVARIDHSTPEDPILVDTYGWNPGQEWMVVNHRAHHPKGSNRLLVDGSAHWQKILPERHPPNSPHARFVAPGNAYYWFW